MTMRPRILKTSFFRGTLIVGLFTSVLFFYLWTSSTSYGRPFHFPFNKTLGKIGGGHYGSLPCDYSNALADAFMAKQTHLLIEPDKRLLALEDPYNDRTNEIPWLLDTSLYQGKYYLYFGPVPVLFLFLPFRFLFFGANIPQILAGPLFGFGGVLFSCLLLAFLKKKYFSETPFGLFFVSLLCLSFSNTVPFTLRTCEIYEIAALAGYFFMSGGLYWLMTGAFGRKVVLWKLAAGSLFLGLATGSRMSLIFGFILLPFIAYGLLEADRHEGLPAKRGGMILGSLFVPFLTCLFFLGFYNFMRFGSWLEFGRRYVLMAFTLPPDFEWDYLAPNLYYYLVQPYAVIKQFPFFFVGWQTPGVAYIRYVRAEPVAGIFMTTPFLCTLLAALFWHKPFEKPSLGKLSAVFALTGAATLFFLSFYIAAATMRYEMDFLNYFLLAALLYWYGLDEMLSTKPWMRRAERTVFSGLILYGVFFALMSSFVGQWDPLRIHNAQIYSGIERLFNGLAGIFLR